MEKVEKLEFGVFMEFAFHTRRKLHVRFSEIDSLFAKDFDKEIDEMLKVGDILAKYKGARPTESVLAEIKAEIENALKHCAATYWDGDTESFLTALYISKKHRELGLHNPMIFEGKLSF